MIQYISPSKIFFSIRYTRLLSLQLYFLLIHITSSRETNGYSFNCFCGLDYLGADEHADIGCQVYSSMNTLHYTSSHKYRTKRRHKCASRGSRQYPMLSRASSCSLVDGVCSDNVGAGHRRSLVRLRRMGRRSRRRSSALMRRACPVAHCTVCWSGAGWRLVRIRSEVNRRWRVSCHAQAGGL